MSTAIVLAAATSIETTSADLAPADAETAVASPRVYVAPKRFDVQASVVRELLQVSGLGVNCAKATLCVQPTYYTNAGALSWCEGNRDEVVVLTRVGTKWEATTLTALSPWTGEEWSGPIASNVAIVVYKWRGIRQWVEVVVSPDSAFLAGAELPTEAPPMSEPAAKMLRILSGIKSSYRPDAYRRNGLNAVALAAATIELTKLGFIKVNKAGATSLTMPGQNAARLLPRLLTI